MKGIASQVVLASLAGVSMNEEEKDFFSTCTPAGVTLFKRNISDPYQNTKTLISAVQSLRPKYTAPLMISIDQEGGRVARIKNPFPDQGPALNICDGRTDAESLKSIEAYGKSVGVELRKIGINVNFAPVCDILTNPSNIAIGDRVFGKDVSSVTKRAGAFLAGTLSSGVLGCLKHFPGQGNADADTHKSHCLINDDMDVLYDREIKPFQNLVSKSPMVMLSHCVYPALDYRPASLSPVIIKDILKKGLGFKGLVVSDDMIMEAIPQEQDAWLESILECIVAGVDLVLVCKDLSKAKIAIDTINAEAKKNSAFARRLAEAAQAVNTIRKNLFAD